MVYSFATGIESVYGLQFAADSDVYDLQGRKVEKDHKLRKGVYIVNGHKKVK